MTRPTNPCRVAELDHDARTVTVAITFKWRRPWALDHCEAGVLVGDLRRLLERSELRTWEQLGGIEACETWDSNEERHIGKVQQPSTWPDPSAQARTEPRPE